MKTKEKTRKKGTPIRLTNSYRDFKKGKKKKFNSKMMLKLLLIDLEMTSIGRNLDCCKDEDMVDLRKKLIKGFEILLEKKHLLIKEL